MSGIAGVIRFDGAPIEPGLVQKMTAAMPYRGPDGINHWVRGSVAMGQCMLCTTPESLEENQPLTNEDDSLVLVMDGRVDNWVELRKELLGLGSILRDRSDAELVLRSYEVWGENYLSHIEGDFALVIWDARRQIAFCARDRVGNKPFYYHWDGKAFAFSSELHTILALPWVKEEQNQGMLAEFLAWEFYSRDETFWLGILRLVPSHQMTIGSAGSKTRQYWSPDLAQELNYSKDEEYFEHYRELFADTVRRMSRSHRTLACEVSGGLDSSAVFCMAEHLRQSGLLAAPGIEGYTLAFTKDTAANEMEYSRAVGEYLNLPIHEVPPTTLPLAWYMQNASHYREFPGYPNGTMFIGIQEKIAMQNRVLLTGQGGDEWLEGSRFYYAEELAQRHWHNFYDCFKTDSEAFGIEQALKWVIKFGLYPLLPDQIQEALRQSRGLLRGNKRQNAYWLSSQVCKVIEDRRNLSQTPRDYKAATLGQRQLLNTLYHYAFSEHITGLAESQNAAYGIELRHPLWSHHIIQYAFSLPERLRLRGDSSKYIHVQALQDFIPQSIYTRKSKAEFSSIFREHIDTMEKLFTQEFPGKHSDRVTIEGMHRLFETYQNNPQTGWPLWVLWSIFGCESVSR